MQTLLKTQPDRLREPVRLKIDAFFEQGVRSLECDTRAVAPVRVTVRYGDNRPVIGLRSENFSLVNAEDPSDSTRLFCVSGFVSLLEAGAYEIAMDGAAWRSGDAKSHCCLVHVTRVSRMTHAIEIGRAQCCMPGSSATD